MKKKNRRDVSIDPLKKPFVITAVKTSQRKSF